MKTGVEIIAEERRRQIEEEQTDIVFDVDNHRYGSLAAAVACYAYPHDRIYSRADPIMLIDIKKTVMWAWNGKFYKPMPDDRIRELARAGALIAAEIDRLNGSK